MRRRLYNDVVASLAGKSHTLIIGSNRTGKTYLLKDIYRHMPEDKGQLKWLSLSEHQITRYLNASFENIFRFIPRPTDSGIIPFFLFLDDIQCLKEPAEFLKYIYQHYAGKIKVVGTANHHFYISSPNEDLLPGKKNVFHLYALDFGEFLVMKGRIDLLREIQVMLIQTSHKPKRLEEIKNLQEEYLLFGALPEVTLAGRDSARIKLLKEIARESTKHIMLENGVENEDKFYGLLYYLSLNSGSLLNRKSIRVALNMSEPTITRYLHLLKSYGVIHLIHPFGGKSTREIGKMPKIYFNDLGIRNTIIQNFQPVQFRQDKATVLDNFLFNQFKSQSSKNILEFWRNSAQHEVEVVMKEGKNPWKAYTVKWNDQDFKPSKYKSFIKSYPEVKLHLLAFDFKDPKNWWVRAFAKPLLELMEEEVFRLKN